MMKYALLVVIALCVAQGTQARSVEAGTKDINDVIEHIKEVIERIKEAIQNIAANLPEIIEQIKQKIEEIAGKIPEIIEQIKQRIEEIIQEGETARQCAEAQREQIDALVNHARESVQQCLSEAEAQTEDLQKQVAALGEKAHALHDDVANRVMQCVSENGNNPAGLVDCLKEQVGPVREQVEALEAEIRKTIDLAKEVAEQVHGSLEVCMQNAHNEGAAQFEAIVAAISECIAASS